MPILIRAVCVRLPEVPVTVTIIAVPVAALLFTVTVNTLMLELAAGSNDAVTPEGRPDADKVTLPVNPFCGVTVIVLVLLDPWLMLRVLGEAESVKVGVTVVTGDELAWFAVLHPHNRTENSRAIQRFFIANLAPQPGSFWQKKNALGSRLPMGREIHGIRLRTQNCPSDVLGLSIAAPKGTCDHSTVC
jgi:hypothetical protein